MSDYTETKAGSKVRFGLGGNVYKNIGHLFAARITDRITESGELNGAPVTLTARSDGRTVTLGARTLAKWYRTDKRSRMDNPIPAFGMAIFIRVELDAAISDDDFDEAWRAFKGTRVIFRKWPGPDGEVIALFPDEPYRIAYDDRDLVNSFLRVGQHGGANMAIVMQRTAPATPQEYAELKEELESAPHYYTLLIS